MTALESISRPAKAAAIACLSISAAAAATLTSGAALAWEPTKSVEFIVPAGTGGGADQMARMIQGIIQKNNLTKQPIVVINKVDRPGARPSWVLDQTFDLFDRLGATDSSAEG